MGRPGNSVSFALTIVLCAMMTSAMAYGANVPKDRVIAMYFHRTQRCPTCRTIGGYSEEAIKTAFTSEMKKGQVEFHFIDFQAANNEKYVKAYGVKGPSLIVAKVTDNKVVSYYNLQDIWAKAGDKPAFYQYVQAKIKACLAE